MSGLNFSIRTRISNFFKQSPPEEPPPPPPGLSNTARAQELIDYRVTNQPPNSCTVAEVNMPKGLTCPPVGWASWFNSSAVSTNAAGDPKFSGYLWGTVVEVFPNYINVVTADGRGLALHAPLLTHVSREKPERSQV